MEMILRIQTFEQVLTRQLQWIRATDVRGRFVATMSTALLASLTVLISTHDGTLGIWDWSMVLVAAGLAGVALLYVWMAAYPMTTGPDHSVIYFGGIDKHDVGEYVRAAETVTEEDYLTDLTQQCHRNGQIAHLKYKLIKKAMRSLFAAVPGWIVAISSAFGF